MTRSGTSQPIKTILLIMTAAVDVDTCILSLYHNVRAQGVHVRLLQSLHQVVVLHIRPVWSTKRAQRLRQTFGRTRYSIQPVLPFQSNYREMRCKPAEKMLMAMSRAYSASSRCRSFIPFENSNIGFMNSNWSPSKKRKQERTFFTERNMTQLQNESFCFFRKKNQMTFKNKCLGNKETNQFHMTQQSSLNISKIQQLHLLLQSPLYYN